MAQYDAWAHEFSYRSYTADMLLNIARSMGTDFSERWFDMIRPGREDTRSGAEIALAVIQKHGLKAVNE